MPTRRLVPPVLLAIAAALVCVPSAGASLTAAWIGNDTLLHAESRQGGGSTAIADNDGNAYALFVGETPESEMKLYVTRRAKGAADWAEPVAVGAAGAQFSLPQAVVNTAGDLTVAWARSDGGMPHVETATIDTDDGSWNGDTTVIPAIDSGMSGPVLVSDSDGVETILARDAGTLYATRRVPGGSWSTPIEISAAPTYDGLVAQVHDNGDISALWGQGGSHDLVTALYRKDADSWTTPAVTPFTGETIFPRMIDDGQGGAAMVSFDGSGYPTTGGVFFMRRRAGSATWSDPIQLDQGTPFAATPDIVALPNDDLFVTWTEIDFGTGAIATKTRTFSAATDAWSDEQILRGPSVGEYAGVRMGIKPNGDIVSSIVQYGMTQPIAIWTRDYETGSWSDVALANGTNLALQTLPNIILDHDGNAIVTWDEQPASARSAHAAIADAAGPEFRAVSVPATARVGEAIDVSVTTDDAWSSVASTSIAFGDGVQATGTSATHAYAAPGRYDVTISSVDSLGNDSETVRTVTVSAPPAPPAPAPDETDGTPAPPKKLDAPIIEARLSGRTITLNAKITLRAGKKCGGKASATVRFGTTTYRTSLKLKTVAKVCRATGVIKLKKTPSTRTKLKVTVSSGVSKTRAVTTKRA